MMLAHQATNWPEAVMTTAMILSVPAIIYVILKYL